MRSRVRHLEFQVGKTSKCIATVFAEPGDSPALIYWSDGDSVHFEEMPEEVNCAFKRAMEKEGLSLRPAYS